MGDRKMTKLLTDLGAGLAWIWMTPEDARRLLQLGEAHRDITFERRGQGVLATAA